MVTCGCDARCCWGLRTPAAYLYWGMVRTGAVVAEAPVGRWPRAWVAEVRKVEDNAKWINALKSWCRQRGHTKRVATSVARPKNTYAYAGKPSCAGPGCLSWPWDGWCWTSVGGELTAAWRWACFGSLKRWCEGHHQAQTYMCSKTAVQSLNNKKIYPSQKSGHTSLAAWLHYSLSYVWCPQCPHCKNL